MKIINKIILGLILLSGSLIADEVKLAWKGCSTEAYKTMYLLNAVPSIRMNKHQTITIDSAINATYEKPWIIYKDIYDIHRKIYDIVYINTEENLLFIGYLQNLNIYDKSLQEQNSIIDALIDAIYVFDCMEVVE